MPNGILCDSCFFERDFDFMEEKNYNTDVKAGENGRVSADPKSVERLVSMIERSVAGKTLKKLILSRPNEKAVLKTEIKRISDGTGEVIRAETFYADGKARHTIFTASEAPEKITDLFLFGYRQLNLITTGGDAESKISRSGKLYVSPAPKEGTPVEPESHNKEKKRILPPDTPCDFLIKLGITDKNGRVYDKKQAKYRQINRFLEYVEGITKNLPSEGTLRILDLCCGKSYLSFAVYYYFTEVLGREVDMIGADLKPDVIEYCRDTANKLGYTGLKFICCDISTLQPEEPPHMVLSLHACNVATDIVLQTAARCGAKVILSTPCCHHELFERCDASNEGWAGLKGLIGQSMIRQKMCEAITDALRCRFLESEGYDVSATELTDPENTPKNLLIRAIKKKKFTDNERNRLKAEYELLRDSFYGNAGGIR